MIDFKKYVLVLAVTALMSGAVVPSLDAADVTFEATVDQAVVEQGTSFMLTLTVSGSANVPVIQLPAMDGIEAKYLGPSTRIAIVNGQYSSSVAHLYNLTATKTGHLTIPSLSVDINGQTLKTDPIEIQVVDSATYSQYATGSNDQAQSLQDKIFIVMSTPLKEAYIHEQIPLSIKLFVNDISVKNIQYPAFDHVGFSVDEYHEPTRYQQVIGGVRYEVIEFKTYIYPTRTGELTLGPATMECNVLFRPAQQPRSPFQGLFDDDFFNSVFDHYDVRQISLKSADLNLRVIDVPAEGRPADFSGAVGQYGFEMTASPRDVHVGDPITLRGVVSGEGDLKSLTLPGMQDSADFKVYDPQTKSEADKKTLEQVVIPKHAGIKEIPALSFSYFDVVEQKYRTLTQGPFPISVSPSEEPAAPQIIGSTPGVERTPENETLGHDIIYIKSQPGRWQNKGFLICWHPLYMVVVAGLLALWAGLFLRYRRDQRLRTDHAFARRLKAPRFAQDGLKAARQYLQEKDVVKFYDTLFKTLQGYFSHKLHLPAGSISVETLQRTMGRGLNETVAAKIAGIFQECESVRYASMTADPSRMPQNLQAVQEIIDHFERKGR